MYNQDVLDLYPRIKVGTKVTVTWQKFSSGGTNSHMCFLTFLRPDGALLTHACETTAGFGATHEAKAQPTMPPSS